MLRTLDGPYRWAFMSMLLVFLLSSILGLFSYEIARLYIRKFATALGFSLFGFYLICRTGSAYLRKFLYPAQPFDLYFAMVALIGISALFSISYPATGLITASLLYSGNVLLKLAYIASRWLAGRKLSVLSGAEPTLRNTFFNALNFPFWMLGAPFIIRHTSRRATTDHP